MSTQTESLAAKLARLKAAKAAPTTDDFTPEESRQVTSDRLRNFLASRAKPTPTPTPTPTPQPTAPKPVNPKLAALLAKRTQSSQEQPSQQPVAGDWIPVTYLDNGIGLNKNQQLAVDKAMLGESFVLTGAAGTGKTTAQAGVVQALDHAGQFGVHNFKYIGEKPSIAIVAFTKVAVRNIQKAVSKISSIAHYAEHCMTIHALLEYEPVKEWREDKETGLDREVQVFKPMRNASNPLTITHLVLEEASMCGLDLWANLWAAMPPNVQIIFLGDINQLQPVFGDSILAYGLNKLPVIELTQVYRQALDNPIIANAHKVLKGLPFETSPCGSVALVTGKAKIKVGQGMTAMGIAGSLQKMYELGEYDPNQDIVLSPWNKRELGTKAMNAAIGTFLTMASGTEVVQVLAGINEVWLSVGDRVMVDKAFGFISRIEPNYKYVGRVTAPPGLYTRTGVPIVGGKAVESEHHAELDFEADYTNFNMRDVESFEDGESISQRAASHQVTVELDSGLTVQLSSGGDFAYEKFQLGYCLTVHKSQGSEWRKVVLLTHYDHAAMLSRELVYTALTRAKEQFICFGKEDVIAKACARAEIKGTTLADKIAYFSAKTTDLNLVPITKDSIEDEAKYANFLSRATV